MNGPLWVLHYIRLETLASDKQSNLLGPFVSYEENEVLWISQAQHTLAMLDYDGIMPTQLL
jgi:hypothetical protein